MPSGAGHDTSHLAALAPAVMIFVPSRDGLSHCPGEWSDFEHLASGTAVLAQMVLQLDES
jgi:acetylornithine deacetylase/succinyl-diaminopimelate desuccinylase-like protein